MPGVFERRHEGPDLIGDFLARAAADLDLESQVATVAERGSVEVDAYYGSEVSSSRVQVAPKQWAPQVRAADPEQPFVQIEDYARTEVKMSTVKLAPQRAVKAGAETDAIEREVTRPTINELGDIACAKAPAAGMPPAPLPAAAKSAASAPAPAASEGGSGRGSGAELMGASGGQNAGDAAPAPAAASMASRASSSFVADLAADESAPARPTPATLARSVASSPPTEGAPRLEATPRPPPPSRAAPGGRRARGRDRWRSPVPSLALSTGDSATGSRASGGPPGSAEEARFDGYESDAVIHEILDGSPRGGSACGLERLAVGAVKLHSKVETASALSLNLFAMEWRQVLACRRRLSQLE
ncbi:unnamed protein product, partial [Prorocentrum cordatum]